MTLCVLRYICLGGSTVPSPTDGAHGYRCPPGFYCPSGVHHELPCKPGTFSPLSGADTCLPCPQGTYCPQAATVEPITCPKGNSRVRFAFLLHSRGNWILRDPTLPSCLYLGLHTQCPVSPLAGPTHRVQLVVLQRELWGEGHEGSLDKYSPLLQV